jgi:hypothetical protein
VSQAAAYRTLPAGGVNSSHDDHLCLPLCQVVHTVLCCWLRILQQDGGARLKLHTEHALHNLRDETNSRKAVGDSRQAGRNETTTRVSGEGGVFGGCVNSWSCLQAGRQLPAVYTELQAHAEMLQHWVC